MRQFLSAAALAIALCSASGGARAHAPLARAIALAPGGRGLAVHMPGFGLLTRASEDESFAYACDALLGLQPDDAELALAFRSDGSLLLGTSRGLRIVDATGCPTATVVTDLAHVPIALLAVHAQDPSVVYAITREAEPAVLRSADGGLHWEQRSRLSSGKPPSALRLDARDPNRLYMSRTTGPKRSTISSSQDGAASFSSSEHDQELVLLHAEATPASRLWAMTRDASRPGVAIVRADQPAGPWRELLRVRFFGGFAANVDSTEIWIGDETGGIYRSSDGGDHFAAEKSSTAVACLAYAGNALWACTPGLPNERSVAVERNGSADFEDVVAFDQVDRLVGCAPEVGVDPMCASAWNEWRRDVQMAKPPEPVAGAAQPGDAAPSAGTSADAGMSAAGGAAVVVEAGPRAPKRATGCTVAARIATSSDGASWLLWTGLLLCARSPGARALRGWLRR